MAPSIRPTSSSTRRWVVLTARATWGVAEVPAQSRYSEGRTVKSSCEEFVSNPGKSKRPSGSFRQSKRARLPSVPTHGDDLALVAYIQVVEGATLDDAAIRGVLRSSLPEVMIPAIFCRVGRLPVSANGKIDRRALPDPRLYMPVAGGDHGRELDEVEQVVLRLWRSSLEMPNLGPDHNFFAAGGTSLQAVVLVGEMADVFGIELSLDTIFRSPSARELAAVIAALRALVES